MQTRNFRWIFLPIVVCLLIWSYIPNSATIGASAQWVNGEYHFAGGTQPGAVALAVGMIGLYFFLMHSPVRYAEAPLPGVSRRFVAFWIDFILAMMSTAPILGIVPMLTEWKRTGEFAWNFERDTPAPYDWWISGAITLILFALLALYNAYPLLRRRPTPGSCIMGYMVVADEDSPLTLTEAFVRPLVGFFAVCTAYVAPFIGRDRANGKFWLDHLFGTHAVKLE